MGYWLQPPGGVSSVNGHTGSVTLIPADLGAAPINSPALTGIPTAPTPATADNSTTLATTAHVQAKIAANAPALAPVQSVAGRTGAVTLAVADIAGAQAALGFTPVNKAGDTGIGNLSMGDLTATAGTFSSVSINPVTLDLSELDQATWYPVTIDIPLRRRTRMRIMVALDSGTVPTWSTHSKGFSVLCDWTSNGSKWGVVNVTRTIHAYTYSWSKVSPVGGISQMDHSSFEVVYLRGGGKYFFEADYPVTPVIQTASYTVNSQTVSPSTSLINNVVSSATAPVAFGSGTFTTGTFSGVLTANGGLSATSETILGDGIIQSYNGIGGIGGVIKFADTQIYGQTPGLAYLQWDRGGSQDRNFRVFTCDGGGNSHQAMLLDANANATFNSVTATTGTFSAPVRPGSYTVATLPAGTVGQMAYATDARKAGEGAGAGTGLLLTYTNGAWRDPSQAYAVATA